MKEYETIKMDKDEFAKFMFNIGLSLKNYNFDVCHDIHTIKSHEMKDLAVAYKINNNSTETNIPIARKFTLFIREAGTNISIGAQSIDIYNQLLLDAEKAYKMTFCWNSDYFSDDYVYCEVKLIKDRKS